MQVKKAMKRSIRMKPPITPSKLIDFLEIWDVGNPKTKSEWEAWSLQFPSLTHEGIGIITVGRYEGLVLSDQIQERGILSAASVLKLVKK